MNKKTRKEIESIISQIEDVQCHIECIKDDEDEKYNNLPDGIQDSERGESMLDAINNLETAYDSMDDAKSYLQEIVDQ